MMRAVALLTSMVAACGAPGMAPAPAFGQKAFTLPFEDGFALGWFNELENREESFTLRRAGEGYDFWGRQNIERMCEFIAINPTPEEDYIVQCYIPDEDAGGYCYYAVWRDGASYRATRIWGASRADLLNRYRREIYPRVREI